MRLKSEFEKVPFFVAVVVVAVVVIDKAIYRRREKSEVKINISQICLRRTSSPSLPLRFPSNGNLNNFASVRLHSESVKLCVL